MKVERRLFLAGVGGMGLGVGLGGLSHLFPLKSAEVFPDWSPGKESLIPSTCLLCPSHCGVLGRVVDGSLVSLHGNPLHPVSRGGLCPKGSAGLQLLYHPARLAGPVERTGAAGSNEFAPVSWDAALARVAGTLRSLRNEGRPESTAWLVGDIGGSMGALLERFVQAYGTPHLVRQDYRDGSDEVMALTQGVQAQPSFDLDRSELVLSFGTPMSEAWWCLPQAARARDVPRQRRPHWVQIDSRLSRTAAASDEFLPVRPGTYGALALAFAYVLLKEGMHDARWIRDGVSGFDDWTDDSGQRLPGYRTLVLRHGRPEAIAGVTGLPVETIVRTAKAFGRARRPVAVWDQVTTWNRGGLADALAIHALNVIVGALQRPGGVFVQSPLPVSALDEIAPSMAEPAAPRVTALQEPDWAERILEDELPIEVLFLYQANPVASAPDPEKVRRALERVPLVVSFSPFLDETARHAHLVLPDAIYLERWQDAEAPPTLPYPVWGIVQPVVPSPHDTRSTGDVLLQLAAAIGDDMAAACPWESMEQLIQQRVRSLAAASRGSTFVPAFRRDELRELEARGWWIPHGQGPSSFWTSLCETGGWFDPFHEDVARATSRLPDGRAALFSEQAREKISRELPGLTEGFLPAVARGSETAGAEGDHDEHERFPLRLMPYRVMTLASGTTPLMPWLLENLGPMTHTAWEPWVEINPTTARELGLLDRRKVRVTSEHGEFSARLVLFEGAQPGVVNAPYGLHSSMPGWGIEEPANPLAAIGNRRDPITGLPDWYTTRVRIEMV